MIVTAAEQKTNKKKVGTTTLSFQAESTDILVL